MDMFDDLGSAAPLARALLLTTLAVIWTLCLVRLVGLRAFSKSTAFDFAATIATGSLIAQAGTRSDWSEYLQAMAAIGAIFLIQFLLAKGRCLSTGFARLVDNRPVLLMRDGEFLEPAMTKTRVTKATLMEKMRMAGTRGIEQVRAVVLETTGDIAVMTDGNFDPRMLEGVRQIQ